VRLRAALASTLVAGLELACDGAVLVIQDEPFGSVNFEAALA
jgi:chromatin segregation and condensation protein Rec8/ScpA/Scc1 (kleisin family)